MPPYGGNGGEEDRLCYNNTRTIFDETKRQMNCNVQSSLPFERMLYITPNFSSCSANVAFLICLVVNKKPKSYTSCSHGLVG